VPLQLRIPRMNDLSLPKNPGAARGVARVPLRDCFYHWFSELEAHGEETSFRLGQVRGSEPEPIWTSLPHHTFDGLGGLHHVLSESYGTGLELPVLPQPYPGTLQRCLAALRVLTAPTPRLARFKEALTPVGCRPVAVRALFTRAQTSELRSASRDRGASLNARLLAALTAAIHPLLEGPGLVNWIVPINMRGVEPDLAPTDNQAATLDISFPVQATARDIHEKIAEQRRRNMHWGVWQLLKWLGAAGPAVIRFVARRELEVKKHGSFSNMGNLRRAGSTSDGWLEPEWWMAVNPVQRTRPLGAACLTYNGRLALTLQVHAVLGVDRRAAQQLMDAWVAGLSQPSSADSKSTAGTRTLPPGSGSANGT
jgi:hypothetical protein